MLLNNLPMFSLTLRSDGGPAHVELIPLLPPADNRIETKL